MVAAFVLALLVVSSGAATSRPVRHPLLIGLWYLGAKIYDVETGLEVSQVGVGTIPSDLASEGDGMFFVTSRQLYAFHYDDAGATGRAFVVDLPASCTKLEGAAQGRLIFTDHSARGSTLCLTTRRGRVLERIQTGADAVSAVTLDAERTHLATASWTGRIVIYRVTPTHLIPIARATTDRSDPLSIAFERSGTIDVAFSPDPKDGPSAIAHFDDGLRNVTYAKAGYLEEVLATREGDTAVVRHGCGIFRLSPNGHDEITTNFAATGSRTRVYPDDKEIYGAAGGRDAFYIISRHCFRYDQRLAPATLTVMTADANRSIPLDLNVTRPVIVND
jgi:hypothetical protein